jgi:hypothetical protein
MSQAVINREFGQKKRSRFWSKADLKTMMSIINNREVLQHGINDAAKYFGVTPNAVHLRYKRFKAKKAMGRINLENIEKTPVKSNMPKGYKHNKKGAGRKIGSRTKPKQQAIDAIVDLYKEAPKAYTGKKRGPKPGFKKKPQQEAGTNQMNIPMKDVKFDLEKRMIVITY